MLPLVIGGVSTRFFAGLACFFLRTGNRSNLYFPLLRTGTTALATFSAWTIKTLRVIRQRARLERDYVPALEWPRHRHLVRPDDELLEHLVDVAVPSRVSDVDPIPLAERR